MRTVSVSSQSSPSDERGLGFAWPSLQGSQSLSITGPTARQNNSFPAQGLLRPFYASEERDRKGRKARRKRPTKEDPEKKIFQFWSITRVLERFEKSLVLNLEWEQ
ncbi:unnamed protein product [Calypogeia fissa]